MNESTDTIAFASQAGYLSIDDFRRYVESEILVRDEQP